MPAGQLKTASQADDILSAVAGLTWYLQFFFLTQGRKLRWGSSRILHSGLCTWPSIINHFQHPLGSLGMSWRWVDCAPSCDFQTLLVLVSSRDCGDM